MSYLRKILGILSIMFFAVGATGCEALLNRSEKLPAFREMTALPPGSKCRIAVLPFENKTDYPLGDAIVQKIFTAEFQGAGRQLVIQEGDILKVYQQLHLLPGETATLEEMQIVADRLNADLLVTGTVLEMRENRAGREINPVIALDIQLRDARSGESLWTAYHRRQGIDYQKAMHFGTLHTLPGLTRQMAVEIINPWQKKGLETCDVSP